MPSTHTHTARPQIQPHPHPPFPLPLQLSGPAAVQKQHAWPCVEDGGGADCPEHEDRPALVASQEQPLRYPSRPDSPVVGLMISVAGMCMCMRDHHQQHVHRHTRVRDHDQQQHTYACTAIINSTYMSVREHMCMCICVRPSSAAYTCVRYQQQPHLHMQALLSAAACAYACATSSSGMCICMHCHQQHHMRMRALPLAAACAHACAIINNSMCICMHDHVNKGKSHERCT